PGRLPGPGLDVFPTEPLPADHPLRRAPNVVLTPHIGWKVDEVFTEWAEIAAEQLGAWWAGGPPPARGRGPRGRPATPIWSFWRIARRTGIPDHQPTREPQSAPDWLWRTRSTMLSRA